MIIPKAVLNILTTLETAGYEAFLVGGCVRDLLLGLPPQDFDVCTNAIPDEMLAVFNDYSVYKTGLKHGTLTVKSDEMFVEVTTYRREGAYFDNRHPNQVEFISELKQDLARRDFTVNALACSKDGEVFDFYGGRTALKEKLITCVGNAEARFTEDSLRILRGLRFAAGYDFTIADETAKAMRKKKHLLKNVSAERIREELTKLLVGKAGGKILRNYPDILLEVLPELSEEISASALWEETTRVIGNTPALPILRWTALLKNSGKVNCLVVDAYSDNHRNSREIAEGVLRRLKFDNKTKKRIMLLIKYQEVVWEVSDGHIKRLLNQIGEEILRDLLLLRKADLNKTDGCYKKLSDQLAVFEKKLDRIITTKACFTLKQLAIKGHDLIAVGIVDGKEISSTLARLLEAVMDERCDNNKTALLQFLKENGSVKN